MEKFKVEVDAMNHIGYHPNGRNWKQHIYDSKGNLIYVAIGDSKEEAENNGKKLTDAFGLIDVTKKVLQEFKHSLSNGCAVIGMNKEQIEEAISKNSLVIEIENTLKIFDNEKQSEETV